MSFGGDQLAIMITIGALIFGAALVFAIPALVDVAGRKHRKRLGKLAQQWADGAPTTEGAISLRQDGGSSAFPVLDRLAGRALPNPDKLRGRLSRTGRSIPLGLYIFICATTAVGATFVMVGVIGASMFLGILFGISIGVVGPYWIVGQMIGRRVRKFGDLFPESIDLIVRGLRSGLPVPESIKIVGQEMADPVGDEFRRISDAMRLGTNIDDAMWQAAKRLDTQEFKFFVISLSVQRETGGNLAETLENLSDLLRKRRQMRLKIRAMSSEARASAYIIGALPFLVFGVIMALNPSYAMVLFTDPRGTFLVGLSGFLMVTGGLVMMKMVKFEV